MAKLLWAFKFHEIASKPLDLEDYVGGLTREPATYSLKIEPRGEERIATIKRELLDAQELLSAYE